MQRLNDVVGLYLKKDTDYALMITGEYGVGKTYYFKTVLSKQISKTPVLGDATKKYRPILISLFGLKSIEEIQTEIFLSLYPLLKNKTVKLGADIGKSIIKGIAQLKGLGEYSDYVSEVKIKKSDWIKLHELVICFDDLERISSELNIEEVIGYINTLVESQHAKVLIIANDNKISRENYAVLKEKVVGNSIEFIADINQSFESLVDLKFAGYKVYQTYLKANRDFIIEKLKKKTLNLRILAFALSYFQEIFSQIDNDLGKEKILKEKQDEILQGLLKFTISISIEYKDGNISFLKREGINRGTGTLADWDAITVENLFGEGQNAKKEGEKTFRDNFIELYYKGEKYIYFHSVYDFITGGSIFKLDALINELKVIYHIVENKISPQYVVFNSLNYDQCFNLTDNEYVKLTKEMLDYSDKGSYEIGTYITVFHFASRYGNPLRFKMDKLEKRIIKGMKRGKEHFQYVPELDFYLSVGSNAEYKNHLISIRKVALEINKSIEKTNEMEEGDRLKKLFYSDFNLFEKEVINTKGPYYYKPILKDFNSYKFYLFFLKANNSLRVEIVRFLSRRYPDYPSAYLKPELEFLEKLQEKVEKKLLSIPKNKLSSQIFRDLGRVLKICIQKLNVAT
jgi:hypothetical protein